ncbi:restriction endonuclease subunit S [Capnocytophaga gingivalis]|uniref:restriction endonuclease subunit S n=1 Tax=Capnocytophaga gingivalis TaxID=1017 RepID=UPI0028D622B8|nr:restriction endonuclease subunit S [Capnocytophaga gingivalis]
MERIRAEKEQLIKDKKFKRDKKDNEPIDEVPFELPEGWEWCRLGEIIILLSGQDLNYKECNETQQGIPYIIGASNFHNGRLNINRWTEFGKNIAEKGEILVTCKGTVGEMSILEIDKAHIARQIMSIKAILCYQKYILYFLSFRIKDLKEKASGLIPGISREDLLYQIIPLPPLAEQHRIAQKVEQLLAIVDTIEQLQEELKALVKQTKNQVLNYAIAGKLTHQDPNDEPAEALLKRIGKTTTTAADTPYEKLPEGWVWCQGNQILNTMKSQKPSGEKFNYIDIASIDNRQNKITEVKTIAVTEAPSRASRKVKFGDTLFSMVRPYLKNIAFVDEEYSNCIASTGFYVCSPNEALFPKYLFYLMVSDYVVQGLNKHMKGDNSPSINNEDITNFIFPLPPLAEQYRIVEKIESFFASFDQIEKELA